MTVAELLPRLERVRAVRNGWMACCPAHNDRSPSLSVREADGKVLLHCFAGCTVETICAALGIRVSNLFTSPGDMPKPVPVAAHERAHDAAWRVSDELGRLRRYYTDALHRAEGLQAQIGSQLAAGQNETECEAIWERLARLAPVSTFFLAAFEHINTLDSAALIRFALMSSAERRIAILGEMELTSANAA